MDCIGHHYIRNITLTDRERFLCIRSHLYFIDPKTFPGYMFHQTVSDDCLILNNDNLQNGIPPPEKIEYKPFLPEKTPIFTLSYIRVHFNVRVPRYVPLRNSSAFNVIKLSRTRLT